MSGKKVIVQDYLAKYAVLIVDKNPSSRNRLLKVMVDIGAKRSQIYTAGNVSEAQEIIRNQNIGIVLADYVIGGGLSGFDLFKMVRQAFPNNKNLCLILVTSNISQTAVAKAAEEDVDSFIIKPYTIQSIQDNLIATISAKVSPSPYIIRIEEGKEVMAQGDYEKAVQIFEKATSLHPRPSLALFYMGQAQFLLANAKEATGKYNKGLTFNSIHFKCLIGLYDVFMKDNRYEEAYQVVRKVAKYFPANPDRLTQIIRLAIITKNYADIEQYYDIFTNLEERDKHLVNYIGAGLYISGKHFVLNGEPEKAQQIFEKLIVSCSEFTKFLRAIIWLLIENGMVQEATQYLSRFPKDALNDEDYLVSEYLANYSDGSEPSLAIKRGLELYNKNVKDINCLKLLTKVMLEQNMTEKAQPFLAEIEKLSSAVKLAKAS